MAFVRFVLGGVMLMGGGAILAGLWQALTGPQGAGLTAVGVIFGVAGYIGYYGLAPDSEDELAEEEWEEASQDTPAKWLPPPASPPDGFMQVGGAAAGIGALLLASGSIGVGIALGLFGLASISLGHGLRRLLQPPEGKHKAEMYPETTEIMDASGQGTGARTETRYRYVDEDATDADIAREREEAARERLSAKPWRARSEWRDGRMEYDQTSRAGAHGCLLMVSSVGGVALMAGALLFLEGASTVALMLFGFAWIALPGYQWYRQRVRARKFGNTTLVMPDLPGFTTDAFRGRLHVNIDPETIPPEGLQIVLGCYRRTVQRVHDPDGLDDEHVELEPLCTYRQQVRSHEFARRSSPDPATSEFPSPSEEVLGIVVPFQFNLTEEAPSATPEKTKERILWRLGVAVEVPGVDYAAHFEVPIFWRADFDGASQTKGTGQRGAE